MIMDKVDLLAEYDQAIRALRHYDVQEDTDVVNQLTDLIVLSRAEKWETYQLYYELGHFWDAVSQVVSNQNQIDTLLYATELLPDFLEM